MVAYHILLKKPRTSQIGTVCQKIKLMANATVAKVYASMPLGEFLSNACSPAAGPSNHFRLLLLTCEGWQSCREGEEFLLVGGP